MRRECFTRRELARTIAFACVFALLFAAAERLLAATDIYSTTWLRVRQGRTPRVLILGNSHAFCSFVPETLSGALGVDCALLGESGQTGSGTTDSLEAALAGGAPDIAIVEVNAYCSESDLMRVTHRGTTLDNINGMPGVWRRAAAATRELGYDSAPQGAFQPLRAELMWSRWDRAPAPVNRYEGADANGYAYMNWFAGGRFDPAAFASAYAALWRDLPARPLDAEADAALKRLTRLCRDNGVALWLVKAPSGARNEEKIARLKTIEAFARREGLAFHDFDAEVGALGLTEGEFYDAGHLSRRGAARFTERFARWMGERIGRAPDWEAAFGYRDERVEAAGDGLYRYAVEAYGADTRFRFTLSEAGGERTVSDWSERNSVVVPLAPAEADALRVSLCPAAELANAPERALTLPMLTVNRYVFPDQRSALKGGGPCESP